MYVVTAAERPAVVLLAPLQRNTFQAVFLTEMKM